MTASIVHVTTVHPFPDPRIFVKECGSLANSGYKVSVLACIDDRHKDYLNYRVFRIGKQTRNRFLRLLYQIRVLFNLVKNKPDIIHFHDPELLPLMCILAGRKGSRRTIIYDVHEDVVSAARQRGIYIAAKIYKWFQSVAENRMTLILAEDSYQRFLTKAHPVVRNFSITQSTKPWDERKNQVVYLGNIAEVRGAITAVQGFAAAQLSGWELVFIGGCDEENLRERMLIEAERLGVVNQIRFTGYLCLNDAIDVLSNSKIGLALLHPISNYLESLPTKVFDYLSVGMSVLLSDFEFYRDYFKHTPAVQFVDPLNINDIGNQLKLMASNDAYLREQGRLGREYFNERYSWSSQEKILLDLYEDLLQTMPVMGAREG